MCQSGACLGSSVGPVWGLSGGQPGNCRRPSNLWPVCGQSVASLGQTQFSLWPHTVWGIGVCGAGPAWDQSGAPLWVKSGTRLGWGFGASLDWMDRPRSGSVLFGASLGLVWGGPHSLGPVYPGQQSASGRGQSLPYILASRPLRTRPFLAAPVGCDGGYDRRHRHWRRHHWGHDTGGPSNLDKSTTARHTCAQPATKINKDVPASSQ